MTHDPNEEVPTASRKFPVIYKVTSKGRAKETWWLYESDAPQAVKKSWRLRVNENKINNAICKKGGVLEGEFKSILSKPSNKERRRMFCLHPNPEDAEIIQAVEDSRQSMYEEWGLDVNGELVEEESGSEILEQEVPPDIAVEHGADDDADMDDITGKHYNNDNGTSAHILCL